MGIGVLTNNQSLIQHQFFKFVLRFTPGSTENVAVFQKAG